LSEGIVANKGL